MFESDQIGIDTSSLLLSFFTDIYLQFWLYVVMKTWYQLDGMKEGQVPDQCSTTVATH